MMFKFKLPTKNKNFFIKCFYGLLSFYTIAGCKKGNDGPQDFSHSVTITGATCSGTNVTLSLQNNAGYTAILGADYPALIPDTENSSPYELSGLQCSLGTALLNGFTATVYSENTVTVTLPPFGTGTAILSSCFSDDFIPCPTIAALTVISCSINPFSEGVGWYNGSSQQITCL